MILYREGDYLAAGEAGLDPTIPGVTLGAGAFTTMLAVDGRVRDLSAHLDRIAEACAYLGLKFNRAVRRWETILARLLDENALTHGHARIRLTVLAPALTPNAAAMELAWAEAVSSKRLTGARTGLRVITLTGTHFTADEARRYKLTGAPWRLAAEHEIARARADEGVLTTQRGIIAEGARSSIFGVSEGIVYTPPLSLGILPSITRAHVLQAARSSRIPMRRRAFTRAQLARMDEIFCGNCILGVAPVTRLDGRRHRIGPVTQTLRDAYERIFAE